MIDVIKTFVSDFNVLHLFVCWWRPFSLENKVHAHMWTVQSSGKLWAGRSRIRSSVHCGGLDIFHFHRVRRIVKAILARECCWKYGVRGLSGIIWLRIGSSVGIFWIGQRNFGSVKTTSLILQFYNTYQRNTHFWINILIFWCLLHVSNPKVHVQDDGCMYSYGRHVLQTSV